MALTTACGSTENAREAAEFYVASFPESSLSGTGCPVADTSNEQGSEVFVDFTIFGVPFMALNGGPMFKFNESISFQIPCADQAEIDHYWALLTDEVEKPANALAEGQVWCLLQGRVARDGKVPWRTRLETARGQHGSDARNEQD